jgi:hypothetical protein
MLHRDSWLLTLTIIGAILAYLAASPPPMTWTYPEWIQFGAALVGILAGKLATSPLPGAKS